MASSSSATSTSPPPPAQAGLPLWARPGVVLVNLIDRYDALYQRVMRYGIAEDQHALSEISVMLEAGRHAEYSRWMREMRMSHELQDWENWNDWFDGPYQLLLAEGRRDLDQLYNLHNAATRQPRARGEQDESDALHDRLEPGFHWPQPEAHGVPLILPQPLSSRFNFRGDLGLGRFDTL